ncbi:MULTISPECIES: hypothetical protein [unclassified Sulfuricurvum]|uniref:hypothetical protein n=1 Tax=unclassified Sulfuricurvum TaxID=2632390 RepID=UPI0002996C83|nr:MULTISPECIES: hypothetical protein [unclassified Sulfuricurvum]AFV96974.1 hypothetical protein B649_03300 [Candidatus Sulfuricurvum sp. RIFRC-1]
MICRLSRESGKPAFFFWIVTPAEKLITIVPKDAPLLIKATVLNQEPVYELAIAPSSLRLKGAGKTLSIHPGMSVTAELKVGKRRVIEFFIYPMIKYLDEGLSVR